MAVTVVHAVLKGDKMDDVVRDAVMMGAAAIQPIVTGRSETTTTYETSRQQFDATGFTATLNGFARHYQTGETIPDALLATITEPFVVETPEEAASRLASAQTSFVGVALLFGYAALGACWLKGLAAHRKSSPTPPARPRS